MCSSLSSMVWPGAGSHGETGAAGGGTSFATSFGGTVEVAVW